MNQRKGGELIISRSISTKVWDQAGIEFPTPGSAGRCKSVVRHVTNCATRPGGNDYVDDIVDYDDDDHNDHHHDIIMTSSSS